MCCMYRYGRSSGPPPAITGPMAGVLQAKPPTNNVGPGQDDRPPGSLLSCFMRPDGLYLYPDLDAPNCRIVLLLFRPSSASSISRIPRWLRSVWLGHRPTTRHSTEHTAQSTQQCKLLVSSPPIPILERLRSPILLPPSSCFLACVNLHSFFLSLITSCKLLLLLLTIRFPAFLNFSFPLLIYFFILFFSLLSLPLCLFCSR